MLALRIGYKYYGTRQPTATEECKTNAQARNATLLKAIEANQGSQRVGGARVFLTDSALVDTRERRSKPRGLSVEVALGALPFTLFLPEFMLAFKRIVTVAALVYLLLAVLFFLFPAVRSSVAGLKGSGSAVDDERSFFYVLAVIGAVILALEVVVENLDSSLLRREASKQESKVNELKAKLYDAQHVGATGPAATHQPSVSYPTATQAAAAERDQHRPDGSASTTITY